jgi:hypothetical protein
MQFLQRLSDVPLKRLYRYALRKTIGPFLLNDVDIDQLDVQIREGKVTLLELQVVGSAGLQKPFRLSLFSLPAARVCAGLHPDKPQLLDAEVCCCCFAPPAGGTCRSATRRITASCVVEV